MLSKRLLIGIPVVFVVILLFWLDTKLARPGFLLMPLYLVCCFFLCREVLDLLNAGGIFPRRITVYLGTILLIALCWAGCSYLDVKPMHIRVDESWNSAARACVWTLLAMAWTTIIAFAGEMLRFRGNQTITPGKVTTNLAGAVFALTYIGVLSSFMVMLRMSFGIGAVLSLVVVAKLCDVGAYTVGRLIGRHKMAPDLSPGKTVEGAVGGLVFACFGAWLTLEVLLPWFIDDTPKHALWEWLSFGVAVGATGALGDLAESLIKRDVRQKDSSQLVPGFGGFLDIFDSLLLAAPIAFAWWAFVLTRSPSSII